MGARCSASPRPSASATVSGSSIGAGAPHRGALQPLGRRFRRAAIRIGRSALFGPSVYITGCPTTTSTLCSPAMDQPKLESGRRDRRSTRGSAPATIRRSRGHDRRRLRGRSRLESSPRISRRYSSWSRRKPGQGRASEEPARCPPHEAGRPAAATEPAGRLHPRRQLQGAAIEVVASACSSVSDQTLDPALPSRSSWSTTRRTTAPPTPSGSCFPQVLPGRERRQHGIRRSGEPGGGRSPTGRNLLQLNPDTVVLDRALDRLGRLRRSQPPGHGLYGGTDRGSAEGTRRSVAPAGGLPSLWSTFCFGYRPVHRLPPQPSGSTRSHLGARPRDTVRSCRRVTTGCLCLHAPRRRGTASGATTSATSSTARTSTWPPGPGRIGLSDRSSRPMRSSATRSDRPQPVAPDKLMLVMRGKAPPTPVSISGTVRRAGWPVALLRVAAFCCGAPPDLLRRPVRPVRGRVDRSCGAREARRKRDRRPSRVISVVVPAHNEAATIRTLRRDPRARRRRRTIIELDRRLQRVHRRTPRQRGSAATPPLVTVVETDHRPPRCAALNLG